MKKTQIIKEIVGKKIEPYGFKYFKTDGPCRIFMREEHGIPRYYDPDDQTVRQYINIQESQYDTILTVRFETDAMVDLSDWPGFDEILRELNPDKGSPWYVYEGEKGYRETLTVLADIIIKYGLDFLKSISMEDPVIPTKKMAEDLSVRYKELDRAFIKEHHIDPVPKSEKDIEEWFAVIREIFVQTSEYPYEEVKDLLVEIAAFMGERSCDLLSQNWIFPSHFKCPATSGGNPYFKVSPLDVVVDIWKNKCDKNDWEFADWIMKNLKQGFLQKNGLPISNEMISPVDNIVPTDEMYCELYDHHAELAERFQRRMELEAECMDEEHINRWFDVIAERMEALHKESYEDAKEELMEIAAFLGIQIERHMDGVWELHINEENDYGRCYVLPSHGVPENILDKVVGGYKLNAIGWIKSECISALAAWRDTPDDLKYKRT